MAIVVREGAHPLSERSPGDGAGVRLRAESLAQVHLGREIERYARKESVGRSVLVAGHRGAGKTTLVLNAIADAQARLAGTGYRALAVRIPAPTLLMSDGPSTTEGVDSRDVEAVLKRVTVTLAQAVLDEVHSAFLERAARDERVNDFVELASRLRIDMERAPSLAGLRDIWRRVGLLERGLFGAGGAEGAGFREILALWSTNEAWQVAGGKVRRTLGAEARAGANASAKWDMVTNGRDLLNPLLGLVSGALVGTSLLDEGGAWAAIGGTLAGILTATGLNFTAARLVEYSQNQDFTFEPDTSVYSLSLLLPRLVAQLRDVGLAPVFVVDELDKVRDLRDKMQALVRHLKYLVTEDAFFCFLTDRNYFEYLRLKSRGAAYPEEYTYFTDRLYVVYLPQDLHGYLRASLRSDAPVNSREARTDNLDADVVRFVLLFRSRMHLIDLKRHLRALIDERSTLSLRPGAVRSGRMFRLETAYQVGVEWVLDQGLLRVRAARDTWFLQLLFDALYYPAERWLEGDTEFATDRTTFDAYLLSRTDCAGIGEITNINQIVPESDLRLLHDEMLRLVAFLREPTRLARDIAGSPDGRGATFPPAVLDALDSREGLLDQDGADRFVWRFDPFGRRLRGQDEEVNTEEAAQFVRGVEALLREIGGPLVDPRWMAEEALVLPSSPSWAGFQLALARLEALAGTRYPEQGEHETVVLRYGAMLRANLGAVGHALVLSALAGRTIAGVVPEDCVRPGLEELGEQLARPHMDEATPELLQRLARDATSILGIPLPLAEIAEAAEIPALRDVLVPTIATIRERGVPTGAETELARSFWSTWRQRMATFLEDGRARFSPELADLLYTQSSGLAALLHWEDLKAPGLVRWSEGVVAALAGDTVPAWVGVGGLEMLGMEELAATLLGRVGGGPRGLSQAEQARWARLLRQRHGQHAAPRRRVLVLCGEAGALARWSCPGHVGALALGADALRALVDWLQAEGDFLQRAGVERVAWVPDPEVATRLAAGTPLAELVPEILRQLGALKPTILAEPAVARRLHPSLGVVSIGDDADSTLERVLGS